MASEQLPTGGSDDDIEDVTPTPQPAKRRKKKKTPQNGRKKDLAKVNVQASPGTMEGLEDQFREDCGVEVVVKKRAPRRSPRKKQLRHPMQIKDGQDVDIAKCQSELLEFKARSASMYPFG